MWSQREIKTPRSFPRFNSRHFKRGCCLNCDCEHLPAESPSKVSYNNPACESLGTPCSHYKGDQSTCPRELCLTFDLCTSTAPNNRASVFVGHTVGTASTSVSMSLRCQSDHLHGPITQEIWAYELIISSKCCRLCNPDLQILRNTFIWW